VSTRIEQFVSLVIRSSTKPGTSKAKTLGPNFIEVLRTSANFDELRLQFVDDSTGLQKVTPHLKRGCDQA